MLCSCTSCMTKRKHLSLEMKVNLIEYAENHPELGVRAIAECFFWKNTSIKYFEEQIFYFGCI